MTVRSFRRSNHVVRIPVTSQITIMQSILQATKQPYFVIFFQPHKRYRVKENYFPVDNTRWTLECSDEISRYMWLLFPVDCRYSIHKDTNETATLCFLRRPLPFTGSWEDGDEITEVGVIARILAAFSLYSFINSRASLRSLILYH